MSKDDNNGKKKSDNRSEIPRKNTKDEFLTLNLEEEKEVSSSDALDDDEVTIDERWSILVAGGSGK